MGENDRWVFYKDAVKEWRWKRYAPNNEVVGAASEGYKRKRDAITNAIRNGYGKPFFKKKEITQ